MLRDEIKMSLRISHNALDDEIDTLIAACFDELERVGVSVPDTEAAPPLYKIACELYTKQHMDFLGKGEQFRKGFESLRDAMALSGAYRGDGDV